MGFGYPSAWQEQEKGNKDQSRAEALGNPFEILKAVEENLESVNEEIEQQTLPPAIEKEMKEVPHLRSPSGIYSSPTYVEVTSKKPPESLGSSQDESFERP